MIQYDTHRWWTNLFRIRGTMVREISGRVAACTAFSVAIVAFHRAVYPVGVGITAHTLVGVALGFLLVFRTNTAYDRYWSGAQRWYAIIGTSTNSGRIARAYLSGDPARSDALVAWASAFPYAAMNSLRGTAGLGPVADRLPKGEADDATTPLAIANRMSRIVAAASKEGVITDNEKMMLEADISANMGSYGACLNILRTPLPFAYVVHLRRALLLYCFTLPLAMVDQYGDWAILSSFVVSYMFFGIEEIGVEIENPFGTDPNDLPLEQYCALIERNLATLSAASPPARAPGRPGSSDPREAAMLSAFQTRKMTHLFHVYDTNRSGQVDRNDFELLADNIAEVAGTLAGSPEHQTIQGRCLSIWERMSAEWDTNQDGKIDLAEWLAARDAMHGDRGATEKLYREWASMLFGAADADKDGKITPDDYLRFLRMFSIDTGADGTAHTRPVFAGKDVLTLEDFVALDREFKFGDDPNAAGSYFLGLLKN